MYKDFVNFVRNQFNSDDFIPLHAPVFFGNEKLYLNECIDSTFVSSVGEFVNQFEREIQSFTGVKHAIATVNGTSALQVALKLAGVSDNDEVITQALTFIATVNSISYLNAYPLFVDVDKHNLGISPDKLEHFLQKSTYKKNGSTYNKLTHRRIQAIVPMHTFGFPGYIEDIINICDRYHIAVIEDAAESLGSYYKGKHTGTFGIIGTLSFNGNKTITTGGGGMILTNDDDIAKMAKHLTTTAKVPHRWEFDHDYIGYNYRLPNLNAALGCAQMENLPIVLEKKRGLSDNYVNFFKSKAIDFISEPENSRSNYWLNAVVLEDLKERDEFLKYTNDNNIMTRPIWKLMNKLTMYSNIQTSNLENSLWLEERVVNIPSGVII